MDSKNKFFITDDEENRIPSYNIDDYYSWVNKINTIYSDLETCKDYGVRRDLTRKLVAAGIALARLLDEPLINEKKRKQVFSESNDYVANFKRLPEILGLVPSDFELPN
jgi:hypothetical protein